MKAFLKYFAAAALLVLTRTGSGAEPAKGYDKYVFVRTRNVFDPERRPVVVAQPTVSSSAKPTGSRPSPVTLTGTMATDGKTLAFFASARAEYNRVVPVNETVAGFKIKSISAGIIEIEHDGKSQVMAVGDSLPIAGAAPASAAPEPQAPTAAGVPADAAAPAAATPAAGSADDVLKRMLERRQKEMSR